MNKNNRVLLAMSGGTDSSVSAIVLKEQGYNVEGITFVMSGDEVEPQYLKNARELCGKLNIPHHSLDLRNEFNQKIINYFVDEYLAGRTPHPCVRCNNLIKWPFLVDMANKLDCFWIATGHYVRLTNQENEWFITQAKDKDKDQSFFLWGIDQQILSRTIFPLGNRLKSEVRKMASDRNFTSVSTLKDSMGICFLSNNYRPFIELKLKERNLLPGIGNFTDCNGKLLGIHNGYPFFTIGQRRGLGLHLNKPVYVSDIIPKSNTIVIGNKNELLINKIQLNGYHFSTCKDVEDQDFTVRIRYRKQATNGTVKIIGQNKLIISLIEPVVKEAAGQTATFYIEEKVIGGGWIEDSWLD